MSLLRVSGVVVLLAFAPGLALANGEGPPGQHVPNESPHLLPLIGARTIPAIQRAKKTLTDARNFLHAVAAGRESPSIGFARTIEVGSMDFRNPMSIAKERSDGTLQHVGFSMEVRVGRSSRASWVPVNIDPKGRIGNLLFSGSQSVFGAAARGVPEHVLEDVAERDLSTPHPLDEAAAALQRAQRKGPITPFRPVTVSEVVGSSGGDRPVNAVSVNK
jgi:hypothetical protein